MYIMLKYILSKESTWCDYMKIYNPYYDPWLMHISSGVPNFDKPAFNKYKAHNFVYDKLFVANSQNIDGNTLDKINGSENYPIFIKPRHGNKSASSKHCYKIKTYDEIKKYKHIPDMIWTEYIDDTEGMTDFFIKDGIIVHQITYEYSKTQHGTIADDWKYVSPENRPPVKVVEWVNKYLVGFTGACNVQYRGDKIIEVGLRLARGGAYIYSTQNYKLIHSINTLVDNNKWEATQDELYFEPFYVFKCYSPLPIVYVYPQYTIDTIMKFNNCEPFYEYYFEPSGKGFEMTHFQFVHKDFNKGIKIKKQVESLINLAQLIYFLLLLYILIYRPKNKFFYIIIIIMFLTKFLNPLGLHHSLYKVQKQALFG